MSPHFLHTERVKSVLQGKGESAQERFPHSLVPGDPTGKQCKTLLLGGAVSVLGNVIKVFGDIKEKNKTQDSDSTIF